MTTTPLCFDAVDREDARAEAPQIQPWKRVALDPGYSGAWVLAGDLNGDGVVEIVSARNVNRDDVHYTSAVAAHDLDGRVLWVWGDPHIGRRGLHHDVACQIHDWDGDGHNEVLLCTEGYLVELDGATGVERRRLPIPPEATDCLTFADLSGRGWASDVLVKTRYSRIWALDQQGKELWSVATPAGFSTAHQPLPVDIDRDGRDGVIVGYAMLDADGRISWALPNEGRFSGGGHLDCCRVLRAGDRPQDWSLVFACCGDHRLMAVDGQGRLIWEVYGRHYESIDIGRVCPEGSGMQLLVDLVSPHYAPGQDAVLVLDEAGALLGRLAAAYTRFHTLVDWDGDGYDEIVMPHARGLFNGRGVRIGTVAMESQGDLYGGRPPQEGEIGHMVLRGDLTGDGVADVAITAPDALYVFRYPGGGKRSARVPLGSRANFTLY